MEEADKYRLVEPEEEEGRRGTRDSVAIAADASD